MRIPMVGNLSRSDVEELVNGVVDLDPAGARYKREVERYFR